MVSEECKDFVHEHAEYYYYPESSKIRGLSIETWCLMGLYLLTLCFTVFNIVAYIWLQKRYKNWLISSFYALTLVVLIFRILQDAFVLKFYSLIPPNPPNPSSQQYPNTNEPIQDIANTIRVILVFFFVADYSKYALGFIQLASMAELTIIIS